MLTPAPLWLRALAALVDLVIVGSSIWYVVLTWGEPLPDGSYELRGVAALVMMLAIAAYWILPEWAIGATVGKLLFRLQVVSLAGGDISFGQSLKRNILRLIDGQLFYLIGFLVAWYQPRQQRLGDLWAKTIVARAGATGEELSDPVAQP